MGAIVLACLDAPDDEGSDVVVFSPIVEVSQNVLKLQVGVILQTLPKLSIPSG